MVREELLDPTPGPEPDPEEEAVEAGLRAYDGALLIVSHDETFLEAVGITRRLTLR